MRNELALIGASFSSLNLPLFKILCLFSRKCELKVGCVRAQVIRVVPLLCHVINKHLHIAVFSYLLFCPSDVEVLDLEQSLLFFFAAVSCMFMISTSYFLTSNNALGFSSN